MPAFWLLVAAPGLYQIGLLLYTVARRFLFPYDLEWMEGGMLNHALRLAEGHSIYEPPSVEFIPYLYTPLYPTLLAFLGKIVGLTYQLGRAISILSIFGVLALIAVAILRERPARLPAFAGAALGGGLFAATYPWVDGWYDLVRGDTLFLALGLLGLVLLRAWAQRPWPYVAAAGALLALTFFVKQTGVLLVATGGAALLFMRWRAVPAYVIAAGLVGGGGAFLMNKLTGGWFWIYAFEVHQQHDTNMVRFWMSFTNIFKHFPGATAACAGALVAAIVLRDRRLVFWLWIFVAGTVIGALGWSTQWAHFNAYIPALTFMGILAGVAIAITPRVGPLFALAVAGQLVYSHWSPKHLIPTADDRAAGDELIAKLRAIRGEVMVFSHPWYAHLAGKATTTHRMGVKDVSYQGSGKKSLPPRARVIAGFEEAIRQGRFAAVIVDDRYEGWEIPGLAQFYRSDEVIKGPRVVSGAPTRPRVVWVPQRPEPPPRGTRILFDFERPYAEDGFEIQGDAFGARPERPNDTLRVYGSRGQSYASSFARKEAGVGELSSRAFTIEGKTLTLRVAGGDNKKTCVELRDATTGEVLRRATGGQSPNLRPVSWDVAALQGRAVKLVLVDKEPGYWGVIWVDDVREVGLP